jgi:hypothetical protein
VKKWSVRVLVALGSFWLLDGLRGGSTSGLGVKVLSLLMERIDRNTDSA